MIVDTVEVRVPATSANLGPGFDSLGLALSLHDVVEAQVTAGGLLIEVTGVGEETSWSGEKHLVVRAMRAAFDLLGDQPPGIRLRCVNSIPHGSGLGSSAAAIVAGILAARALCGEEGAARLPDSAVLGLAAELEGHADNVAACLAGGLTIAWPADVPADRPGPDGSGVAPADPAVAPAGPAGSKVAALGRAVRCARLDPLPGLTPVVCVPSHAVATDAARQLLPATVPHADAAKNAARSALLIAALSRGELAGDPQLLLDATRDYLHQPYRESAMPGTARLVAELRDAGIPAVVSGAGPAVLALITAGATASPAIVAAIAAESGGDWTVMVLDIDRPGATVLVEGVSALA